MHGKVTYTHIAKLLVVVMYCKRRRNYKKKKKNCKENPGR